MSALPPKAPPEGSSLSVSRGPDGLAVGRPDRGPVEPAGTVCPAQWGTRIRASVDGGTEGPGNTPTWQGRS